MRVNARLVIITGLIMSLAGIGYFYKNTAFFKGEGVKEIYLILRMQRNDYWKSVRRGAEIAAKEFNVKVDIAAPVDEKDAEGQIDLVNEAIKRRVDALIIAPNDYNKLAKPAENAVGSNIPVLTIDSKINSEKVSSYIATNNINAGENLGKKVVEIAGENSEIAVISFAGETGNFADREKGLMNILSEYPGVKVLDTEYNSLGVEGAGDIAKDIITKYKNVDAIVAFDSESSIGAARVIDGMRLAGKVKVFAFDSEPEEISYLENGVIQAAMVQSPFSMGYLAVKCAVLELQGRRPPKFIDTGLTVIDRENMYLPANQKILFPFTQ